MPTTFSLAYPNKKTPVLKQAFVAVGLVEIAAGERLERVDGKLYDKSGKDITNNAKNIKTLYIKKFKGRCYRWAVLYDLDGMTLPDTFSITVVAIDAATHKPTESTKFPLEVKAGFDVSPDIYHPPASYELDEGEVEYFVAQGTTSERMASAYVTRKNPTTGDPEPGAVYDYIPYLGVWYAIFDPLEREAEYDLVVTDIYDSSRSRSFTTPP